jgi:broad specificity phosphatase PhoE
MTSFAVTTRYLNLLNTRMKIVLIRHFKVGFKWKRFYNSSDYELDCGGYNTSPVVASKVDIASTDRLITSTMSRALETSKHIFNREPDLSDDDLCEVPIKPFMKTKIPLPKLMWDIIGRLQWRFGISKQPESYAKSRQRVRKFLESLIANGENVVIVCHGWIIKLMIRELNLHGFKGPNPVFIRNGQPYEFVRPDTDPKT